MTAMAKVDGATAVAAPSAKTYVIYFPFNSSTLTEASARMVEQAIDDAKAMGGAKITLTGHTRPVRRQRLQQAFERESACWPSPMR